MAAKMEMDTDRQNKYFDMNMSKIREHVDVHKHEYLYQHLRQHLHGHEHEQVHVHCHRSFRPNLILASRHLVFFSLFFTLYRISNKVLKICNYYIYA